MSSGPQQNNDGSVCWSWKDDFQWQSYVSTTNTQIENACNNGGQSVVLNTGPYFGQIQGIIIYIVTQLFIFTDMLLFVEHNI